MRLLIASDLHGSYHFGKALFDAFEREKADRVILLGDLLYHGARNDLPEEYSTKALTVLLNKYADKILAVRGNCDSEIDQTVLDFPMMSDYLIVLVDGRTFVITHGHIVNEDRMLPHAPGTVLLHGHTHLKVMEKRGDFYYLNPGSVSIPKDDDRHTYMIYDNDTFIIKEMDGTVVSAMKLD